MSEVDPVTLVGTVATRPRPEICRYLSETDDAVTTLEELTTALLTTDQHRDKYPQSSDWLAIRLQHVHLPKLDAIDVIDYDHDRQRIVPAANLPQTEPVLQAIDDLQN